MSQRATGRRIVHRWEAPAVVRLERGAYVPRQECRTCGRVRNPLTGYVVWHGDESCLTDRRDLREKEYDQEFSRLQAELELLESAGEVVERAWTGTSRASQAERQHV